MKNLFIDIGSTNIKWQSDGEVRYRPFPRPIRDDAPFFEVGAEDIFDSVKGSELNAIFAYCKKTAEELQ